MNVSETLRNQVIKLLKLFEVKLSEEQKRGIQCVINLTEIDEFIQGLIHIEKYSNH